MRRRKISLEFLEKRLTLSGTPSDNLSDYIDISQLAAEPTYTTVDASSNHLSGTGTPFDGVVKLTIATNQGTFLGSGTLLPTGMHILTAAHNVTSVSPAPTPLLSSIVVTFELPTGTVTRNASLGSIQVHPDWDRTDLVAGADLAILELTTEAPTNAPRFDIYRGTSELASIGEKAGYGQSGQGVVTIAAGDKRDGQNRYEFYADASADVLLYDFDNGTSTNDTFGLVASRPDLGTGNEEVMTAPGDSGGPTLIGGKIAGVTSFRTTAIGGIGDSVAGLNSSFGEIGGDTRVSKFENWVDAIVDGAGAPQVVNVKISGSSSLHSPFHFDDPANEAGDFDGSGIQLRTVPVGGADTVSIQFSEHVLNVAAGSLSLTGLKTGAVPALAGVNGFSYDIISHTATWRFSSPLSADQFLINLDDSVVDVIGNNLDGEWINPFSLLTGSGAVSVFPSGNTVAGGDFNFVFTILPGDANLDNQINGSDFSVLAANYGQTNRTFGQADFNGDGIVNANDHSLLASKFGTKLRDLVFADFNHNSVVNGDDIDIWDANFGTGTTFAQGDVDGDGDVDTDDFLIAQRQSGLTIAWA